MEAFRNVAMSHRLSQRALHILANAFSRDWNRDMIGKFVGSYTR